MEMIDPRQLVLFEAQHLVDQLDVTGHLLQQCGASPTRRPRRERAFRMQLARALLTAQHLADQLDGGSAQQRMQGVTRQLDQIRVTAAERAAPTRESPPEGGRLAEQLAVIQVTLQHVVRQLEYDLDHAAEGRLLEEPPHAEAGEA